MPSRFGCPCSTRDVGYLLLVCIFPPLGVAVKAGCGWHAWEKITITVFLTLVGWAPGMAYGFYIINAYKRAPSGRLIHRRHFCDCHEARKELKRQGFQETHEGMQQVRKAFHASRIQLEMERELAKAQKNLERGQRQAAKFRRHRLEAREYAMKNPMKAVEPVEPKQR